MPTDQFKVYKAVQHITKELVNDRVLQGEAVDYATAREAMLELHCDWQDLMTAVKRCEIPGEAAQAAVRLAAAAIKFAMDLGDPKKVSAISKPRNSKITDEIRLRLKAARMKTVNV